MPSAVRCRLQKIRCGARVFLLAVPRCRTWLEFSRVVDIFLAAAGSSAVATVGLTEPAVLYMRGHGTAMAVSHRCAPSWGRKAGGSGGDAVQASGFALVSLQLPSSVSGSRKIYCDEGADEWTLTHGYQSKRGRSEQCGDHVVSHQCELRAQASVPAMRVCSAKGLKIVLDPIFLFGLDRFRVRCRGGVATTIGRGVGVLMQLGSVSRKKESHVLRSQRIGTGLL